MFRIIRTTINEKDIEDFLFSRYIEEENLSQEEVSASLCAVSEKAGWIIDSILSDTIQEIENWQVRNWFRRFLISEKYGVLIDYPRGGTNEYCIMFASDDCVLVNSPHIIRNQELIKATSTIILSPQGEIMVQEGQVWLNERSLSRCHGFTARWKEMFGIYSEKGTPLFPCIFDYVQNDEYLHIGKIQYKGCKYQYILLGTVSQIEKDHLAMMAEDSNRCFCFQSDDKVYQVVCLGFVNDGEIHHGAITIYNQEGEDTFSNLPKEEQQRLIEENKDDLRKELCSYHHIFTKDELLTLSGVEVFPDKVKPDEKEESKKGVHSKMEERKIVIPEITAYLTENQEDLYKVSKKEEYDRNDYYACELTWVAASDALYGYMDNKGYSCIAEIPEDELFFILSEYVGKPVAQRVVDYVKSKK